MSSDQTAVERGSAEWRQLELERRTIPAGGIYHHRATPSSTPVSPNVETYFRRALQLSAAAGLIFAFLLTRWRGERPGDGATIMPAQIGKRFTKISLVLCGLFVAISLIIFLPQPRAYRSTATLEFLPHDPATFATQLEILKSRAPLQDAVIEAP